MSNERNNLKDVSAQVAEKISLDENELGSVSGGFTIIDTCQNHWVPGICNAIWGKCPHLCMTQTGEKKSIKHYVYYSVSCSKGCFSNKEYEKDISI